MCESENQNATLTLPNILFTQISVGGLLEFFAIFKQKFCSFANVLTRNVSVTELGKDKLWKKSVTMFRSVF